VERLRTNIESIGLACQLMNAWLRRKIALQVFNKNGAPRAFPDTFLIGTRLRDVQDWSLVGAVLREADLSDANLSRAKLVDAIFRELTSAMQKLLQCRLSPGTIRPCGAKGRGSGKSTICQGRTIIC
jgi:uncharacterized protein YjbI with pentapeptide repeats